MVLRTLSALNRGRLFLLLLDRKWGGPHWLLMLANEQADARRPEFQLAGSYSWFDSTVRRVGLG